MKQLSEEEAEPENTQSDPHSVLGERRHERGDRSMKSDDGPSGNPVACNLLTLLTLGIRRFISVPQGYVRLVMAFGKYVRAAQPGLDSYLSCWGLYQHPGPLIPLKEQVREYPRENVFTRDGVSCAIDAVVFFTIKYPEQAIFEVEDYEIAIRSLVQATLRNECGNLAARELLAGREKLAQRLRDTLDSDTAPWGIAVRLVEITGIEMMADAERKGGI